MQQDIENRFLDLLASDKDRLFRICRSYSDSREEAQDLFQDVLMNIWKSLPAFKEASSIHTWAYRIAVNVCLRSNQLVLKKERHFTRLESVHIDHVPEVPADMAEEAAYARLEAEIRQLQGMEKTVILLHLEGLPYKEIGQVTGLTENHVAVKIKRTREKLLTRLTPKTDEE